MSASRLASLTAFQASKIGGLFAGLKTTQPINNFVRVMPTTYAINPLSFGFGSSRFSPLATTAGSARFGVLYGAIDVGTASYEAIVRDRLDMTPARIMRRPDYNTRSAVNFSNRPGAALTLLDLTAGNAVRFGVPTDVIRCSDHQAGQYFSEFVYKQMPDVDGILYASRFTEQLCVAVYDRAVAPKLMSGSTVSLTRGLLRPIMAPWNIMVM